MAKGINRDLIEITKRTLSREESWINWKSQNCPMFVRKPTEELSCGDKRKWMENTYPSAAASIEISLKKHKETIFDCSDENVKDMANNLAESVRSLDFLVEVSVVVLINVALFEYCCQQTYLEADDPEAGIEEEYHPKNDQ
jgi:hypothetical protein